MKTYYDDIEETCKTMKLLYLTLSQVMDWLLQYMLHELHLEDLKALAIRSPTNGFA